MNQVTIEELRREQMLARTLAERDEIIIALHEEVTRLQGRVKELEEAATPRGSGTA